MGVSLRALALGLACLAGGLLPAPAATAQGSAPAQTGAGQPMPLLVIPSPDRAPPPGAPAKGTAAPVIAPAPVPLPSVDPRDVSVVRQNLTAPPLGVLAPDEGGFPATLWVGTPVAALRALVPAVPDLPLPTLHALARRLLLTAAPLPADSTPSDAAVLAVLRLSRLLALGQLDGARQLAETIPASLDAPDLPRLRWEALALSGRMPEACAALNQGIGTDDSAEVAEGRVLCQLVTGNAAGASLGLDVLRDRKPHDLVFLAAADALNGLPPRKPITTLRDPTPVQFAALHAAKLPLPDDAIDTARPVVLAAIAGAADLPPDQRLAAAERAEALGILNTDSLRKLVDAYPFSPGELALPLARIGAIPGPRALALLARAAETTPDPATRVALLSKALDMAAARGRFPTAARLLAPQIAAIGVQTPFAAFAPAAARALLIAGQPGAAEHWLDLAGRQPDGAKAASRLWPLARAWGIGDPSPGIVEAWVAGVDPRQAALALSLLSGLGQRVPATAWLALLSVPRPTPGANPAVAQLLAGLSRDSRLGGTVLATLVSLDAGAPDKVDPNSLSRAVAALKTAGLEPDARRLAVELMLAGGI